MKQIAAVGLIFVLSAQCFYKLGIISYYQLNRDYIAEVLCINKEKPMTMCHGQCFLKRNLDLADEGQKVPAPTGKDKVDLSVFLISDVIHALDVRSESTVINSPYFEIHTSGYFTRPFHPPSVG